MVLLDGGVSGGEERAREGRGGEAGSDTATREVEDVSEWMRSGSTSPNGFSSSAKGSIIMQERVAVGD